MRAVGTMIASVAALAMVAGSTAAVAARSPAPQEVVAPPQTPNAWMMLSVLSPTRAVALGGANAAAHPADAPPPPPPGHGAAGWSGEMLPFILWFGLIAIALTISDHARPNSPA